ncbi:Hypothetical protein PBC10988_40140 [Planctomycetales bacterium 10988]|nr:Hypothetical protein PBC10988_40140 [Planctomycetales bacterium 10988]
MDERVMQFRVGVMVLATLIITGILIMLFGELPALATRTYTVKMHFDEAPGVTASTPVRKSGLLIGRVTEVELDEEGNGVWVTAELEQDKKLRKHELPRITGSLLGDATIEFFPARNIPMVQDIIVDGTQLEGSVTPDPLEAIQDMQTRLMEMFDVLEEATNTVNQTGVSFQEASLAVQNTAATIDLAGKEFIQATDTFEEIGVSVERATQEITSTTVSIRDTSDEWRGVAQQVNALFQPEPGQSRVDRLLNETERAVQSINRAFGEVDATAKDIRGLVNDPKIRENLDKILLETPRVLADAREAIARLNITLVTANRNLENIEGITQPLGERGPEIVDNLSSSVSQLDGVLEQIDGLMGNINNVLNAALTGNGTIAELVNNPDLYQNLNEAAETINRLLREAQPILKDARVFTDKISRHPEVIGLGGAVRPSSGIK